MFQAKNNIWHDDSESLLDKMNQAIAQGFIDANDFKVINESYSALIKSSITLTISPNDINHLEDVYSTVKDLPTGKDKPTSSTSSSLQKQARTVIDSAELKDEDDVTRYVAALNFLYAKRAFKTVSEGTKYLNILLENDSAKSLFSVFDFSIGKNGKMYDVTIGIGGYSFRLNGICQLNMKAKLEAIRKPKGSNIRLSIVNLNNIEQMLNKFINQ